VVPDDVSGAPLAFENQHLTSRASRCGGGAPFIDVNEPRINPPSSNADDDLYYNSCGSSSATGKLTVQNGASIAVAPDSDVDADGCADAIRTANVGADPVVPKVGETLCVVSSRQRDLSGGVPQTLARLDIDTISSTDGALSFTITGWHLT
jgi:hypothetical protein